MAACESGPLPWSLFLYNHLLPSSVSSLSCPNAALTKPFTKEEAKFMRAESTWEPLPPNPEVYRDHTRHQKLPSHVHERDNNDYHPTNTKSLTHCCFPNGFCRYHLELWVPLCPTGDKKRHLLLTTCFPLMEMCLSSQVFSHDSPIIEHIL